MIAFKIHSCYVKTLMLLVRSRIHNAPHGDVFRCDFNQHHLHMSDTEQNSGLQQLRKKSATLNTNDDL